MLDKVCEDRQPLVITKRGKPVAQVVPIPTRENIVGSMKGSVLWMGERIAVSAITPWEIGLLAIMSDAALGWTRRLKQQFVSERTANALLGLRGWSEVSKVK